MSIADSMWQKVIADMQHREQIGYARYGRYLTNGSAEIGLEEAYEEALDQVVYLKKAIEEKQKKEEEEKELLSQVDIAVQQVLSALAVSETKELDNVLSSVMVQLLVVQKKLTASTPLQM